MEYEHVDGSTAEANGFRRCTPCDVTWWGEPETACWFCGSPGRAANPTRRIYSDETAA